MQALQVWIEPVLRVAIAISAQIGRVNPVAVLSDGGTLRFKIFVNIVAKKDDEVRMFVREMAVG